jgi:hypothetical protein
MRSRQLSAEQVRDRLRRAILAHGTGSQSCWARAHGISPQMLSDILSGYRNPGPRVLGPLGLRAAPARFEQVR